MNTTIRRTTAVMATTGTLMLIGALPASADPKVDPKLPGDLDNKMNSLLGILAGIAIFACVAGIIIVAIKMAVAQQRGELGQQFMGLAAVLIACVLVGSAAGIVQFAL